jgi:hypothetical protein
MTDFTREEIRSQLNMQGFDPPEPVMGDEVVSETRLLVHRAIDVLKDLGGHSGAGEHPPHRADARGAHRHL